jgi:hypothetical protein
MMYQSGQVILSVLAIFGAAWQRKALVTYLLTGVTALT